MIRRSNFLIKLTDLPRFCVFFQEINFSLACFIHLSFLTVMLTISIGFTYNKESPLLLMSLSIFYFFSLNFNASRNVCFFRDFVEVRVMRQYERFASLSIALRRLQGTFRLRFHIKLHTRKSFRSGFEGTRYKFDMDIGSRISLPISFPRLFHGICPVNRRPDVFQYFFR